MAASTKTKSNLMPLFKHQDLVMIQGTLSGVERDEDNPLFVVIHQVVEHLVLCGQGLSEGRGVLENRYAHAGWRPTGRFRSARVAVDGSFRNCDGARHGLPFRFHDETPELV